MQRLVVAQHGLAHVAVHADARGGARDTAVLQAAQRGRTGPEAALRGPDFVHVVEK